MIMRRGTCCVVALFVFVVLLGSAAAQQAAAPVGPLTLPRFSPAPESAVESAGQPGGDVQLGGLLEPAVAVNPVDPANVAEADLYSLRVSTDNGTTWSTATPTITPGTHVPCGDSSLAFDSAGRLFWTYLACLEPYYRPDDIFIAQVNPATGAVLAGSVVNVTGSAGLPAAGGYCHDKPWLAADHFGGSPFQDRLYVVWTQFVGTNCGGPTAVRTAYSSDHGQSWTPSPTLSGTGEGYTLPAHDAVAANGDVYVAYHSQIGSYALDGVSGQVFVLRSVDGGVSYPQKTLAFAPGNADVTYNIQNSARTLDRNRSLTIGSTQPWVVPDPALPNAVSVVASDDPTNSAQGGTNDDTAIYIVRSIDSGATWGTATQVDRGPGTSHQLFPTAAIDPTTQCLTVQWYDSRVGLTNGNGDYLLDVFMRSSADGGVTFAHEMKINDAAFDPDLGAIQYFPPATTLRIGEYIGVSVYGDVAHAVWTGNTATGQQIVYDNAPVCKPDADADGCPDSSELQTAPGSERSGGRRDPLNPWDYFNPTHDGQNRVDDILAVIQHFGKNRGDPGYSTDYDRTGIGPNPWNLGPPDGQVRVADIIAEIHQYGHDCA
jgi:hypothetical protein